MFWRCSCLLNLILGGDPREPLSSRLGRNQRKNCKFCDLMCFFLAWLEPEHCARALERHLKRLDRQR
jgi:hypothetical protein